MGSKELKGKVIPEFKVTRPRKKNANTTEDLENNIDKLEMNEVLDRIANIRRILKAMKFPIGSFNIDSFEGVQF